MYPVQSMDYSMEMRPSPRRQHTIPRKPVGQPTYHYQPAVSEDDERDQPKRTRHGKLQHNQLWKLLMSFLFMMVPILFAVLGILTVQLNGKTESNSGKRLMNLVLLVPSVYPIMFAVLVGRSLKSTALHMAQRGTTLLRLEQLLSSSTLGSAISTAIILRTFNLTFILLLALWALSPLGGQAALRMITVESYVATRQNATVWYLSSDDHPGIVGAGSSKIETVRRIEAIYISNLFAVTTALNSSVDIFGNLKIPMIELQDVSSTDNDGWIAVPSSNVTFSSLTGIPFQGVPTRGNGTFTIENSYTYFNCTKPVNISGDARPPNVNQSVEYSMWFNMTEDGWLSKRSEFQSRNITKPRSLSFISRNFLASPHYYSYSTCLYTETYVEASITCSDSSCGCTAIRHSLKDHLPSHISRWDGVGTVTDNLQTRLFSSATDNDNSGSSAVIYSSITERFLENPMTPHLFPYETNALPNLTNLSAEIFSIRLATAYNTYFGGYKTNPGDIVGTTVNLASLENPLPNSTRIYGDGGSLKPNQPYRYGMLDFPRNTKAPYLARSSEGVWTEDQPTYTIHWKWALIYFFSVGFLALGVVIGIGVQSRQRAPEIFMTVGGALRDSRYVKDTRVLSGSWMDGYDTTINAGNIRVAIRDVKAGELVGRVALVGGEDDPGWGDLSPGKRYE